MKSGGEIETHFEKMTREKVNILQGFYSAGRETRIVGFYNNKQINKQTDSETGKTYQTNCAAGQIV